MGQINPNAEGADVERAALQSRWARRRRFVSCPAARLQTTSTRRSTSVQKWSEVISLASVHTMHPRCNTLTRSHSPLLVLQISVLCRAVCMNTDGSNKSRQIVRKMFQRHPEFTKATLSLLAWRHAATLVFPAAFFWLKYTWFTFCYLTNNKFQCIVK